MSTAVEQERRCAHVGDDGERCGVKGRLVDADTGLCWTHDPAYEDERKAAREKGGMRTALKAAKRRGLDPGALGPLETLEDALRHYALVAAAVAEGRISASAANAHTRAVAAWERVHEATELKRQLDEMRAERNGNGGRR